jgi:ParB/RepB/Spo0J family partition protein
MFDFLTRVLVLPREQCTEMLDRVIAGINRKNKEKERTMQSIPLDEIMCEANRKYTTDDGFEQLVESVRKYGILQPPVVRRTDLNEYRVIAGRRRVAAAKRLGLGEVVCSVKDLDDPDDDEEVALTENVNRLETHPLDEAAQFRRMADSGRAIEEIARYYARSPSAIYKRLRLCSLSEDLKGMFRDGMLDIAGAALLAELPEEDQKEFSDLHGRVTGRGKAIDSREVSMFIFKRQKFTLRPCMNSGCEGCRKRTHNWDNALFEEYNYLEDVCLDGDCYRAKWHEAIEKALAEKVRECAMRTEDKIVFESDFSDGIPERIFKQATHMDFKGLPRFEVLKKKDYEFHRGPDVEKKKTGCCWRVGEGVGDDGTELFVQRVSYKAVEKVEKTGTSAGKGKNKLVEGYGEEVITMLAAEREILPEELAADIKSCGINEWDYQRKISEAVADRIIGERLKDKTPMDYFKMFLDSCFGYRQLNDRGQRALQELFGVKKLEDLKAPDELQPYFHLLLLCEINYGEEITDEIPDLEDITKKRYGDNPFFEYAGLTPEEYRDLYQECAREVTGGLLKPAKGAKKKGKKKNGGKELEGEAAVWAAVDATVDAVQEEDNYPFEPDREPEEGDPDIEL